MSQHVGRPIYAALLLRQGERLLDRLQRQGESRHQARSPQCTVQAQDQPLCSVTWNLSALLRKAQGCLGITGKGFCR